MTYDHWKTTEPESGYDPPEPSIDVERLSADIEERMGRIIDTMQGELDHRTAERNRYEAALRKIAAWKGYEAAPTWFESDSPLTEYETGANDMLEVLAGFAKEALAP